MTMQRTAKVMTLYHGTDPKNYRSVRSKGLLAKRKGGWGQGGGLLTSDWLKWESLDGNYLTNDMYTAILASNDSIPTNNRLIVIVSIDTKKLAVDEDDIRDFVEDFIARFTVKNDDDIVKNKSEYRKMSDEFLDSVFRHHAVLTKDQITRLKEALSDDVLKVLRLSNIAKVSWKLYEGTKRNREAAQKILKAWGVKAKDIPPYKKAYETFAKCYDQLLRLLGPLAERLMEKKSIATGRYPGDIGFDGNPKIVGIIEIIDDEPIVAKVKYAKDNRAITRAVNDIKDHYDSKVIVK